MLTWWGHVPIRAAGSIILWKKISPGEYSAGGGKREGNLYFQFQGFVHDMSIFRSLVEAGIDSFKIEGRMKTALYVADVAQNLSTGN